MQGGGSTSVMPVRGMRHRGDSRKTGLNVALNTRIPHWENRKTAQTEGDNRKTVGLSPLIWERKTTQTEATYSCDQKGYLNFSKGLLLHDRYEVIQQIGKGTFSRVMACKDLVDRRLVAVKCVRNIEKYQHAARVEMKILNKIKRADPNDASGCAQVIDHFEYFGHPCFVFKLYGRNLYSFLTTNRYLPFHPVHVKHFAYQILKSVAFLHSQRIIFTDLKPENIVFENERTVRKQLAKTRATGDIWIEIPTCTNIKIIDFGSALFENMWHSHLIQTRHYRAPEVVLCMRWSFPVDMWSVGCIILELLYGRMVFNTHDSIDHLSQMETMIGPMPDHFKCRIPQSRWEDYFYVDGPKSGKLRLDLAKRSPVHCKPLDSYMTESEHCTHLLDVLRRMLQWCPEDRITAEEALKHPYFDGVEALVEATMKERASSSDG